MPLERVRELHLAGHTPKDSIVIDTHIRPIVEAGFWALYRYTLQRAKRLIPTLIEWDEGRSPRSTWCSTSSIAPASMRAARSRRPRGPFLRASSREIAPTLLGETSAETGAAKLIDDPRRLDVYEITSAACTASRPVLWVSRTARRRWRPARSGPGWSRTSSAEFPMRNVELNSNGEKWSEFLASPSWSHQAGVPRGPVPNAAFAEQRRRGADQG